MISPDAPAAADIAPSTTNGTSLTFDALKAHFPHVLDIYTAAEELSSLEVTSVNNWFKTDSKELVDPSALPRIIGRAYYLRYGKQVDPFDVKRYLKNYRDGFAQKPIPLNRLGRLVADAVKDLAPEGEEGKKKKSPYLTLVHLKKRFSHLFPEKAGDAITFDTTTPVDTWFTTESTEKVHPTAVSQFIGRIFTLKHGIPINTRHRSAYLNGSAQKPVELRHLPKLVSKAVDVLIKGPTEKPEKKLEDIPKGHMKPLHKDISIFQADPNARERVGLESDLLAPDHPEKIMSKALTYTSWLKGTSPDAAKGTEEEICTRVQRALEVDFKHVDRKTLRDYANAAWDNLGVNGARYESDKKGSKPLKSKPLNLAGRTK